MQNNEENVVKYDAESMFNERSNLKQIFSKMFSKRLLNKIVYCRKHL